MVRFAQATGGNGRKSEKFLGRSSTLYLARPRYSKGDKEDCSIAKGEPKLPC
jgi:hypothetical protein